MRPRLKLVRMWVAGAICVAAGGSARAQGALVTGNLVIAGGGTNTEVVRYTDVVVGGGTDRVIQLSAAFHTLVIRGPKAYADACRHAGECWDSDVCAGQVGTSPGACGMSQNDMRVCESTSGLDVKLDACARLLAAARRDPVAGGDWTEIDRCIATGTNVAALAASCPVRPYRSAYDKATVEALARMHDQLQVDGGNLVTSDVRNQLQRIGAWYDAYRQLYPPTARAAHPQLLSQTSLVLRNFWRTVHTKVGFPAPQATNPQDALLDTLFRQGLQADRTVLEAAFTAPVPITTAPLVELMGDALQSMSARMVQVGRYHDVACRFRHDAAAPQAPCAGGRVKTEIGELTRLLASAAHPAELSSVLASAPPGNVSANWVPWRTVFDALSTRHASAFQAAVLDALPGVTAYDPDLIAPPDPERPRLADPALPTTRASAPLMKLAKVIQEARLRANSFHKTGLFDSRYQGTLRAGIEQSRLIETLDRAQARSRALRDMLVGYKSTRLTLANTILQQMANQGTQQKVTDQITQQFERQKQLRQDLAGLRNVIEVQEARFGDFMGVFNNAARIVESEPETSITHDTATLTVSGAHARWESTNAGSSPADGLATFAANPAIDAGTLRGWPVVGHKGDIVNVSTAGQWSPSCALRAARFTNPITQQLNDFIRVPIPALTGPEGYLLSVSGSTFSATFNSSVHSVDRYSNVMTSQKLCGGGGFSLGVNIGPVSLGNLAHGGYEACRHWDSGTRTSDVTSNGVSDGTEDRMGAAFTTGLRVPGTPFEAFPAGTLLVVQVAPGGTTRADVLDVQVLQKPYSSVVLRQDADVYLAVNDVRDRECTADTNALTVSMNVVRPFGSIARELGRGMADALAQLRGQQALLLEQGRVGPQQMTDLRDQAFQDLVAACGTSCPGLSHYPPAILKLFDAWVSKELATIERKVDARTIERELVLVGLELQELAHDLSSLGAQARLLQLIPTWLLQDLDTHILHDETQHLLELYIAELYPVVDLRHPEALQSLDPVLLASLLGSVRDANSLPVDWAGSLVDWTTAVANAADNIVNRVRDRLAISPLLNDRIVAIGVPRPGYASGGGSWQRVTPERAAAFWGAIDRREPFASLTVSPSDLYRMAGGATDVLHCNDAVPVVTGMAIYMVRPGWFEEYPGLYIPVSLDRNLRFPGVGAMKDYRIDNSDWINYAVRVAAGEAVISGGAGFEEKFTALMADSATPLNRAGNGLSPFGQFDIELAGLTSSLSGDDPPAVNAVELVLGFRVTARNVASIGLHPMCQ